MKTPCTLFLTLFLFTCFAESKKPNVLFILTDDQSHRTVSCYDEAYKWARTPNIDELAKNGVRFTHCYSGSWCQPSRLSSMTGLLQHKHESFKITTYPMAQYDPQKLPFWPKNFRQNGYYTACIGKWNFGEDHGFQRDWDECIVWDRSQSQQNARAYYNNQLLSINGGPRQLSETYSTDNYTQHANDFIKERAAEEKPWMLWLCYCAAHAPYTPAPRHLDDYKGNKVKIPTDVFGPRPGKPDFLNTYSRWRNVNGVPCKGRKTLHECVQEYNETVISVDEAIGRLINTLKQTGQYDNTIIIFNSDQGYAWGEHGYSSKQAPYDANIRAPLIFSCPKLFDSAKVVKTPVNGVDITTAIHRLCGIKEPWKMHGRDITPLLSDKTNTWQNSPMLMMNSFYEYGNDINKALKNKETAKFEKNGFQAWIMMIKGKYKYIRYLARPTIEEIYDIENDPQELRNLAVSIEHQKLLKELRTLCLREFEKKDADFLELIPAVKTKIIE